MARIRSHRTRPRAFALAAAAAGVLGLAVAGAQASSGGASFGGGAGTGGASSSSLCPKTQLGSRTLKIGDCGADVQTLNWILRSKDYAGVGLDQDFADTTEAAVRAFQRNAGVRANGVVEEETNAAIVRSMPAQTATWYGPGFIGNQTACGQTLTRKTVGVAHRKLACGSKVVIRYKGRYVRTKVIDRGPFANGAKWDLTQRTAQLLSFEYTDEVRVAKLAKRGADRRR